jgi:hypothetical protein
VTVARVITLQPSAYVDNLWSAPGNRVVEGTRTPYPFHVREDGAVEQQDLWQGDPAAVVGFVSDPEARRIDTYWRDVWADPSRAVGLYVVTRNAEGAWATWPVAIETAEAGEVES